MVLPEGIDDVTYSSAVSDIGECNGRPRPLHQTQPAHVHGFSVTCINVLRWSRLVFCRASLQTISCLITQHFSLCAYLHTMVSSEGFIPSLLHQVTPFQHNLCMHAGSQRRVSRCGDAADWYFIEQFCRLFIIPFPLEFG